ncbi:hypothetical protein FOZ62_022100, partial [Perkinsus olseni]
IATARRDVLTDAFGLSRSESAKLLPIRSWPFGLRSERQRCKSDAVTSRLSWLISKTPQPWRKKLRNCKRLREEKPPMWSDANRIAQQEHSSCRSREHGLKLLRRESKRLWR